MSDAPSPPGSTTNGPDADLTCPRCGYSLHGLPEPRCPECGLQANWDELRRRADRSLDQTLFEFQWRRHPVRSFFGTAFRTLIPWSFWPRLALTGPPRIAALSAFAVMVWLFLRIVNWFCRSAAGHWITARIYAAKFDDPSFLSIPMTWPWFWWRWYCYEVVSLAIVLGTLWLSANLCFQLLAIKRIRGQANLLRLIVYSGTAAFLVRAILDTCHEVFLWFEAYTDLGTFLVPMLTTGFALAAVITFGACFVAGCSMYLKLRAGWLWGITVLALTFTCIWRLLIPATVRYYDSVDNPWTRLAGYWWPGASELADWILPIR